MWLTRDEDGAIALETMAKADTPLAGIGISLLVCEIWERR
jgi:superoxide dismutase